MKLHFKNIYYERSYHNNKIDVILRKKCNFCKRCESK